MKEEYGDDHKEAMAHAIASTITSVVGSSITTVECIRKCIDT